MGAFCTLDISSEKQLENFVFVHLWFQYCKNALNSKEKFRNMFCDVSKSVINSKF